MAEEARGGGRGEGAEGRVGGVLGICRLHRDAVRLLAWLAVGVVEGRAIVVRVAVLPRGDGGLGSGELAPVRGRHGGEWERGRAACLVCGGYALPRGCVEQPLALACGSVVPLSWRAAACRGGIVRYGSGKARPCAPWVPIGLSLLYFFFFPSGVEWAGGGEPVLQRRKASSHHSQCGADTCEVGGQEIRQEGACELCVCRERDIELASPAEEV